MKATSRVWLLLLLPAMGHGAGQCFLDGAATCEHRGAQLEIGDTWMKEDCYQCVCLSPFGVGCCDSIQQPVDYPEWCEVVLRPDSCQLEVVMKANPRIPCLGKSFARRLLLHRARVEENRRWIE